MIDRSLVRYLTFKGTDRLSWFLSVLSFALTLSHAQVYFGRSDGVTVRIVVTGSDMQNPERVRG